MAETVVKTEDDYSVERSLGRDVAWCVAVLVVMSLQAVLVLRQQPGLDEWQALQIALQSPTLAALFENLRYEGHPPLWYFLLQVASLALPAGWVLKAVQLPIAMAVQGLILARLPLTRIERLSVACSFAVLIDYGMLARSMGMGVLLFLAALLLRRRRMAWLPLILLPMADFLFGCLSIICLAIFWKEKRLWAPGIGLWLASALVAAWSVRPLADMSPAYRPSGVIPDGLTELARFGTVMVPLQMSDGTLVWNGLAPTLLALPAGLLFLYMGVRLLWWDRFACALFAGFCALILTFSIAVYPLAIRHVSLAGLLLIMLMARQREAGGEASRVFTAWLAITAVCGLLAAAVVLVRPFHAAPAAARYMEAHGLAGEHWVTFPDSRAQGVSGLLGIEFERLEVNCTLSFVRWNFRSKIEKIAQLEQEFQRIARRGGGYYLLSDQPLPVNRLRRPQDFKLLTHIPSGYDGQHFYLYRIWPDVPEHGTRPPKCPPARLTLRTLPPS